MSAASSPRRTVAGSMMARPEALPRQGESEKPASLRRSGEESDYPIKRRDVQRKRSMARQCPGHWTIPAYAGILQRQPSPDPPGAESQTEDEREQHELNEWWRFPAPANMRISRFRK